jgi:hypothetical protein
VAPGLEEVCDGKDNDCDGTADEGFDDDDDGYASCATAFWPADCADDDATIHPGAIDLCRLDGAGQLIDSDCRDDNDSCPPNGRCCPEQEGCVALDQDNQNCRACGSACGSEEYCFAGACHDEEATPQIEVADDQVPLTAGNGLSAHPALDWNWARRSAWLRWWEGSAEQWLQYPYWLVSYGIAWVHQEYGESRLVFARRQFVSAPVPRPAAASEAWDAVVAEVSEPLWSPATEVARLTTEDALPDLTAFEDLGYALVWSDGSDYQQVQITVIGADGGADGWSSQITNEQAHHHYPRIATSSAIEEDGPLVGVVYQREEAAQAGDEAGNMQVYFQSLRGLSERRPRFGPPVQLSYDEQGGLTPAITWTPIGFAVVWVNPAEANLYFALLNESGVPLVASQQVTFGGNVLPWRPSLAWHEGAERFGIAYQGSTPPDNEEDIYFQALDGYGTPRGSPVALTNYDGLQRRPVLAATDVGYAVAWEDEPTSLGEVHLVQLSLDGKVTQGPTTLSRQGGAGQVATPCLAFATLRDDHEGTVYSLTGWRTEVLVGTGELAAVWQDQPTSIEYSVINFLRLNEQ